MGAPRNNESRARFERAVTLDSFEQCLEQYEPMISATIRKLHVYRDFEQFRQVGRIALWQAWKRFDHEKGAFAPYASRSMWGAMIDYMKSENRYADHMMQTEDEQLLDYIDTHEMVFEIDADERLGDLVTAFSKMVEQDRLLIKWLYIEKMTQKQCAERLGISVSGVKKRRERVLGNLRSLILTKKEGL